jgi:hypothetical protein
MLNAVAMVRLGKRLLGRPLGQKHYGQLCQLLADAVDGKAVYLDFADVESVNGSWINAAIAPLFPWSGRGQIDVFPILCSFPPKDRDELELVCQLNSQCFPLAKEAERASRAVELVGPLDPTLEETLRIVVKRGEVTGADLGRDREEAGIGPTGWNNRLRELYERRLVFRKNVGRKQLYSAIAKEVVRHG